MADSTVPSLPGGPSTNNCTISLPTSSGAVPILITDASICTEYESTGNSFCALSPPFRDAWAHTCATEPAPGVGITASADDASYYGTAAVGGRKDPVQTTEPNYGLLTLAFALALLILIAIGIMLPNVTCCSTRCRRRPSRWAYFTDDY
ncbi:hypothetical protein F4804DRAFT_336088 [Jackrogersella minutella]|nr:hypothetical protein F4804DRAFT_336088 [Jackrogersella minutella]